MYDGKKSLLWGLSTLLLIEVAAETTLYGRLVAKMTGSLTNTARRFSQIAGPLYSTAATGTASRLFYKKCRQGHLGVLVPRDHFR